MWYGFALLVIVLVGTGILIGRAIPSAQATPVTEHGTVTWVNEGLTPAGGPAVFVARLDGMARTQTFTLASFVQWTTAGNATWEVPGSSPPIPSCLVPPAQKGHDGFGPVHAHIKFGVVHVPMPDGEQEGVVVWVRCQ